MNQQAAFFAGPFRPRHRRNANGYWPYLLLSPFLLVFILFFVAPVVIGAYDSLFRQGMVDGRVFVGLDNYARIFADEHFWGGMIRVLQFGAIFIPATIGAALLFALAIDVEAAAGGWLFRLVFFLPYIIPGVVATVLWGFLYGNIFGPFNQVAGALGIGPIDFLGEDNVLLAIGNIDIWLYVGYDMIVFLAALQAVPREHTEAAILDGASRWQVAWRIKAPQIAPVLSVVVIFSIIGTLQLFTEPRVLQASSPDVIGRDFVPNLYLYSLAATGQQFNYVAAMSFVLAAVVLLLAAAYGLVTRGRRS